MKSLEETVRIVGLSRRAIQEYEKAGVIPKPAHRTKRGYLRYDDQDISRLFQVRFYRELGYETNEILEIFHAPNFNRQNAITCQISEMRKKKERLEDLITIAEALRDQELDPEKLMKVFPEARELPFDVVLSAFSGGLRTAQTAEEEGEPPEDGELEVCFDLMEKALELILCGYPTASQAVQSRIDHMYRTASQYISSSIFGFWGLWQLFAPEEELGKLVDEQYGTGSAEMLYQAACIYSRNKIKALAGPEVMGPARQIEKLHRAQYAPDSPEVQEKTALFLSAFYRASGLNADQWRQLSGLWKREAFLSWDMTPQDREQLAFLARSIEIYREKKEDSK